MTRAAGTRAADAILAATIPATATRLLVHPTVATSLASSVGGDQGADVDVAVGAPGDPVGRGAVSIVVVDASDGALDTGAGGRLVVRARDHLASRLLGRRAAHRLRAAGYRSVVRIPWDRGQVAHLPGAASAELRLAERLPRRVVVVAGRSAELEPSIFTVAASAAGLPTATPRPLVRSGTLVTLGPDHVVRVAVGAGRDRLDRAASILRHLADVLPRRHLLPVIDGEGEAGIGRWTVERRLRGRPCPATMPPEVEDDVVDLLASFVQATAGPPPPMHDLAVDLATALGDGRRSDGVRAAADALEEGGLLGLPGAVGHGDFWHGNLLLRDGRLSGVIDWDSGALARLPFLDLLHLVITARVPRGSGRWGVEVVRELRSSESPPILRRYAETIGIPVDERRRRALVVAYWLDRVHTQVRTYGDRTSRQRWLEANVDHVLAATAER